MLRILQLCLVAVLYLFFLRVLWAVATEVRAPELAPAGGPSRKKKKARSVKAAAELVQLPGRRALILVRPEALRSVAGVSVVPLSDGRAFIALDAGSSAADLEVAVLDRLDAPGVSGEERAQLIEFCQYALARGAEMWAHIPAFAERRMGVGVPLSMVPLQKYEEGSRRVQWTGHPDLLPVVFHNDAMSVYEVRHRPS